MLTAVVSNCDLLSDIELPSKESLFSAFKLLKSGLLETHSNLTLQRI